MVTVHIQCVGAANGHIVQQAEAVAPMRLILTGHNACRPCVMPWRSHSTEGVPGLQASA